MYKQCLMQRQCRNVHKRTIQSTATKIDRRRRRNSKRRAQTNKNRPVFGQYMVRVSASENCKTNGKMNDGCNWWLTENGGEIERKRERESGKGHTHTKRAEFEPAPEKLAMLVLILSTFSCRFGQCKLKKIFKGLKQQQQTPTVCEYVKLVEKPNDFGVTQPKYCN